MAAVKYEPLKKVFYRASSGGKGLVEGQLAARRDSPSTLEWGYEVNKFPLFAVLTRDLVAALEDVWRSEILIAQLWETLPRTAREHYIYELLVDEIKATNDIENISSTRKEVAEAVAAERGLSGSAENSTARRFKEMVRQYLEVAKPIFGVKRGRGLDFPESLQDIRALYDSLLGRELAPEDVPDGELFRSGDVAITDGARELHSGARGEAEIQRRLSVMLENSARSNEVDLCQSFAEHFMFEHIHPFYDGNGRMGRFLLSIRLSHVLSAQTALSLSSEIFRQKSRYYDAFKLVEDPMNYAELTFFLTDMTAMLRAAQTRLQDSLTERLARLRALQARMLGIANELEGLSENAKTLLFVLGQVTLFGPRAGITLDELARVLAVSKQTARKAITELESLNVVEFLSRKPIIIALNQQGLELLQLD